MIDNAYKIEKKVFKCGNHALDMMIWHILRFILNVSLPLYYKTSKMPKRKDISIYTDMPVILSLTSFPDRIRKIGIVLESLLRQSVQPTRIILWLAEDQFPNKEDVENFLRSYTERGVEVKYCDDIRSHKKYYYAMKDYPDAIIITADDDILYPSYMVENLIKKHLEFPNCIIATRAHKMRLKNDGVAPYSEWNYRAKGCAGPDIYLCPTGCAGCLYPPGCMSDHIFDKEVLMDLCLYADDIWLKCMSYLKETQVVLTGIDNPEIIDIIGEKKGGLAKINVEQSLNDTQLNAVTEYYGINWNG